MSKRVLITGANSGMGFDVELAQRLWTLSEELCGLEPSLHLRLAA